MYFINEPMIRKLGACEINDARSEMSNLRISYSLDNLGRLIFRTFLF